MDKFLEIVKKFQLNDIPWITLVILCWLAISHHTSLMLKLKGFPTVGSSLPFLSLITTFKFMVNAQNVVDIGISKWPRRLFKVPVPRGWRVIVTEPNLIEEMSRAPEYILSGRMATVKTLQTPFTLGPQILDNPYHRGIIRGRLTKTLPKLVPEMYDEILHAFSQYILPTEDWYRVKALEIMTKVVVRANNRIFVGLPLCRHPDWIKICTGLPKEVVFRGFFIGFIPPFLRPLVTSLPDCHREGLRILGPLISAIRAERSTKREENPEKPEKLLEWLMTAATGEEQEDPFLVARMLTMNFVSVHTSSMAITHALFDLASSPEYLHPLREEAEEVIKRGGWTKASLDQMPKLDSFIKESLRLHPLATLMMDREPINGYTFADGTKVPAGATLSIALKNANLNPDSYDEPLKFDGFRFIRMKERATLDGHPQKNFDMVTTNVSSLSFGHGRHVCPGRFFASTEMKLMLAYVVTAYDVKMREEGVRPPDDLFVNRIWPNPTAEVLFRRRKLVEVD